MFWVLCRVHWNRGKVHHRANVMVIVLPSLKWWSRQSQLKYKHNSCRQLFADVGSMPLYEARQQQFKRSNTWWKLQLNTTDYCNKPCRYHLWHFVRRKLCDTIYCYVKGISSSTPSALTFGDILCYCSGNIQLIFEDKDVSNWTSLIRRQPIWYRLRKRESFTVSSF